MTVLQKLFSFQGRLRRRDYWLLGFLLVLVTVVLMIPLLLVFGFTADDERLQLAGLVPIWPMAALQIKRIHDRNKSGWLAGIYWVPYVTAAILNAFPVSGLEPVQTGLQVIANLTGLWFLVEFGFMDGTQGPNRYGKSPKGVGGDTSDKLADVFA